MKSMLRKQLDNCTFTMVSNDRQEEEESGAKDMDGAIQNRAALSHVHPHPHQPLVGAYIPKAMTFGGMARILHTMPGMGATHRVLPVHAVVLGILLAAMACSMQIR
jgi:hypothetical protein